MSYGSPQWNNWVKGEEESIQMIKDAYNAGINFFDTANTYSNGASEIILGKALKQLNAPRGRVVIATKVYAPVFEDVGHFSFDASSDPEMVNRYGLSRKHIFDAVEASLKRLDVDYIDLYQIHRLDKVSSTHIFSCAKVIWCSCFIFFFIRKLPWKKLWKLCMI
jgi:aryl-alcohol dehydrogenase-like predicted oxidoreductase